MNHVEIAKYAREKLDMFQLTSWKFHFDSAQTRAGACWHSRKLVTLSWHYVQLNQDKPEELMDTVLHEIAHALAGYKAGHGPLWREVCRIIGAKPQRCYDSSQVAMPAGGYKADCPGCKRTFSRHRPPRQQLCCSKCGADKGKLFFRCPPKPQDLQAKIKQLELEVAQRTIEALEAKLKELM